MRNPQAGLGVIQLVVVTTILLAVFGVITKTIDKQNILNMVRTKNARSNLMAVSLQSQLEDPLLCTTALAGETLNVNPAFYADIDKGLTDVSSLKIGFAESPGPIGPGWKSESMGIQISKIQLKVTRRATYLGNVGPVNRFITYDWPNLSNVNKNKQAKYYVDVLFRFAGSTWNAYKDDRPVKIAASVDPATNKIVQCHGVLSVAEVCEAAGGAFDASSNSLPEQRCNPDLICFNSKVGLVTQKNLCVYPYEPTAVGMISGTQNYLCSWCNRNH